MAPPAQKRPAAFDAGAIYKSLFHALVWAGSVMRCLGRSLKDRELAQVSLKRCFEQATVRDYVLKT